MANKDGYSTQMANELLEEYGSLLTVEDVAEVLSVSKRTIYRLVGRGELPVVKVGHRLYFPRASMAERLCLGA